MVILLCAHVPALTLLALAYGNSLTHSLIEGGVVMIFALPAALLRGGARRPREVIVTLGLLTCSASLVHVMNGAIEAHFHFFVMVAVLGLYEDWVPFLLAIAYVLLHHGFGSAFAHDSVFNHGGDPWLWAGVHTFFITCLSVAIVVNWRAAEKQRDELRTASADLARAHAKAEARAAEFQRSNRELEQFAYVASHDLGEPLRMISSYLQLIERRAELDEQSRSHLDFAVDGATRMRTLIDDLLLYSRAGRVDLKRREVPARDLVEATVRGLAGAIDEAHATVEVGELPVIACDPVLLGQVFQNLIANGIKFQNGDAPHVTISGREVPGGWEFVVSDNGIGILAENRERIFKMFQRLHHREEYQGTGIGLSVCQRIVERHDGKIRVEAGPGGRGSTFVFTIASNGPFNNNGAGDRPPEREVVPA